MKVGVPRETAAGERRVALVPETVKRLAGGGFEVAVERGAGEAASFPDPDYEQAGAALVDNAYSAEAVVKVQSPSPDEAARLRDSQILIGFLQPLTDREGIDRLSERGVVAFAMESIPRITRAQAMDALSSQATVSGYKAAVLAADRLPKFFPMLMTAAGTVAPAKVLVLGAGVAGLQAIATSRRLGAVVSGFDVRPIVREQVESLGATFLDLGVTGEETAGGYARELTEQEQRRQQQALEARLPEFDAVITTALVPGRPAPRLIPAAPPGGGGRGRTPKRGAHGGNRVAPVKRGRRPKRREPRPLAGVRGDDPRAGDLPRLRGDLEGADTAAHAADVGDERDSRDRDRRRDARCGARPQGHADDRRWAGRRRARLGQRRRWLRRHRPHARDVQKARADLRGASGPGRRSHG